MKYDAVILAGGQNSGELREIAPYDNEALIVIAGVPMILYVYKTLKQSAYIKRIVVSGPVDEIKNILPDDKDLFFVEDGENAIESFNNAVSLLQDMSITNSVLVMPTDIPFITREAVDDFINQSERLEGEFFYAITSQEVNEKKFPGVSRTYVKLKEGIFTGGNLFLIDSGIIDKTLDMAVQLVMRRKDPLAMGRLFGLCLVWSYLFKKLSIDMAERRFYKVMGIKGKAIISPYAEVGVDVDKPSDFELAQEYLMKLKTMNTKENLN